MARVNITWGDKWEYEYEGHKIVVRNGFDACQLLVDGQIQDAHNGLSLSATLTGKVGDKPIKVTLGGLWKIKCSLFVDHQMLEPVKHDD